MGIIRSMLPSVYIMNAPEVPYEAVITRSFSRMSLQLERLR
jgi:hypothetical protein